MALTNTNRAETVSVPSRTPRQFDAVPLLTVYMTLLCTIPAVYVLPGLGAAGRPAALFAIGLFALWACIQVVPSIATRRTPLRWPLLFYSMVLVLSYGFGFDRGPSEAEALSADRALLTLIATNGIVLMASEGLPTPDHVAKLTKRLSYFGGFVAMVGLIQFVAKFDPYSVIKFPGLVANHEVTALGSRGRGTLVRVKGPTLHPIEFAVVMALSLPAAVHHALHETNRILRNRRWALVALIGATSMFAVSRSAIVGLATACVMLVWSWSPKIRLKAALATLAGLVALRAVVPGLLGTILSLFLNWGNDNSISGRTEDFAIVGAYVSERPWLGRGTGTFIPEVYITLDNAYLKQVVSTGWIGLFALLLLLFSGFFFARHCARRGPDNRTRHLGVTAAAMIAVGLASGATFSLYSFPNATGFTYLGLGTGAVLSTFTTADTTGREFSPPGLLRLGYRTEYQRKPWWHRFDPELRDHR